ncbi:hypothetical protein PQR67_24225 [Paraburkholderia fungorum]|uniref:hypothetical protein n=1 Tax=Paraburkholderia fungorum TaxID=134537 RepID=UPI0038B925C4
MQNPRRVVTVLLIAVAVVILAFFGTVTGSQNGSSIGGYSPAVMAYWLQALGTLGVIVWYASNAQSSEQKKRKGRAEQTRAEIGNLAFDTLHFIARNVEAMRRQQSAALVSITSVEFAELLQRMTAVRQLPLGAQEMNDVIALRSNLVDSIALVDSYREQGNLSNGDYGLLERYQNDSKQILDRRDSDRRMHRS